MSRVHALLLGIAAGSVAPAAAQVMVNGPQGCDLVTGLADGAVFHALDEEHMIFDFAVLEAIEYHCAFEPAFSPYLEDGEIQTRIGYCMEPGPFLTPGVFTLMDRGDGMAQLDSSFSDDPILLDICGIP
jgi:parvulin-like peptidyl-prolyl isomerase